MQIQEIFYQHWIASANVNLPLPSHHNWNRHYHILSHTHSSSSFGQLHGTNRNSVVAIHNEGEMVPKALSEKQRHEFRSGRTLLPILKTNHPFSWNELCYVLNKPQRKKSHEYIYIYLFHFVLYYYFNISAFYTHTHTQSNKTEKIKLSLTIEQLLNIFNWNDIFS